VSRRTALWAAYWALVLTVMAVASLAAAIPFTGADASAAGVTAAGLVGLAGLALEPRKDGRP
jgi:hypothetical protein